MEAASNQLFQLLLNSLSRLFFNPMVALKQGIMTIIKLESSSSSSSHGSSFKPAISASSQQFKPPVLQSHGSFEAGNHDHHKGKDGGGDDNQVFDDEKRKVHTGPNPLHNR
ncbi:hypothetical protein GOBAR_DD27712 [Gossypium barbadense]|nr:hypothetical protein GOBAR_DD27712 [Gossypium barbadense]